MNLSRDPLLEAVRYRLFQAALPHIPEHGITLRAVAAVAPSFNLPKSVTGLFPDGDGEVISMFLDHLKSETRAAHSSEEELPKLEGVIATRLKLIEPYINHWPDALATDPITCGSKLFELVDAMADIAAIPTDHVCTQLENDDDAY